MRYLRDYRVRQEKFEGPLDLLLELIEKEKLSISEISLAKVTEDYLREIKTLEAVNHEDLAEFLVIAARLILIKSRSLLPTLALSDEEEESIADLERRLKEYAAIKELAKALKLIEREQSRIFGREAFLGVPAVFYPPAKLKKEALAAMIASLLQAIPAPQELEKAEIQKTITLEEKISEIKLLLEGRIQRAFSEFMQRNTGKTEIIIAFLAILELAKQKLVFLHQEAAFGDIIVKTGD